MASRIAIVRIDDDRVTDVFVEYYKCTASGDEEFIDSDFLPVPPDDQLARDLDEATDLAWRYLKARERLHELIPPAGGEMESHLDCYGMISRLRASAGLDDK